MSVISIQLIVIQDALFMFYLLTYVNTYERASRGESDSTASRVGIRIMRMRMRQ
jgi:hypothetical protein